MIRDAWGRFWKNERGPLLAVLLLALFLRAGVVFVFEDSIFKYREAAEEFAIKFLAGKGFGLIEGLPSSYRPPMYPFFLVLVYGLFGRTPLSAGLSQAVLSTGTCFVTYLIGRKTFDRWVGLLAAFFVAVYPYLVYHDVHVNRTVIITFFMALTMLFTLKVGESPSQINVFLAGLFLGMNALAQPTILAAFPFLALWLFLRFDFKLGITVRVAAGVVLATCLTLLPWVVRNYRVHDSFVLVSTEVGRNFWKQHNDYTEGVLRQGLWIDYVPEPEDAPGLGVEEAWRQGLSQLTISEVDLDRWYMRKGLDWVKNNPGGFLRLMGLNLVNYWSWRLNPRHELAIEGSLSFVASLKGTLYTVSYGFVLLWAIVGLTLAGDRWKQVSLFVLLFLAYTLIHMIFVGITRYRMPLDPLLCVLAGNGVAKFLRKVMKFEVRPAQE